MTQSNTLQELKDLIKDHVTYVPDSLKTKKDCIEYLRGILENERQRRERSIQEFQIVPKHMQEGIPDEMKAVLGYIINEFEEQLDNKVSHEPSPW